MAAKKKAAKPVYVEKTAPVMTNAVPAHNDWRDPDWRPADDDEGLEARMWRIAQRQQGKA
jgi:hypothetical protein